MNNVFVQKELERFLLEDLGTTRVDNRDERRVVAHVQAQQDGVMCGGELPLDAFALLTPLRYRRTDPYAEVLSEGQEFKKGDMLMGFETHPETLRHGIRTGLNLMMEMCGIATHTRKLQQRVATYGCTLLDTRKTTPGLRAFQKEAVLVGGAANHRHGRYDGVMLKREDLLLDGGVHGAVQRALKRTAHLTCIEVEVDTLDELRQVLELGHPKVRHVLLDNMAPDLLRACVALAGEQLTLEASGVDIADLETVAATGVPYISTSSLILDAKPLKMHLVMGEAK